MPYDACAKPVGPDQSGTALSDNEIVDRILGGDSDLYQLLIRRYNRRLYHVAWAIVHNEHEAEDVVQETYFRAYTHLAQFAGRSSFSTWLTRIAVREAWRHTKGRSMQCDTEAALDLQKANRTDYTPEDCLLKTEARTLLENAIEALPLALRSVFVMRSLEEMSIAEIANCLDITQEAVKMRLLRARQALRRSLYTRARVTGSNAFQFLGERCDRITATVMYLIRVRVGGAR